jgi:predicted Zn-dependent protease with MMP-like domain
MSSWLERAREAYEEGRLEDSLRLLEREKAESREAWVLRAHILAEIGLVEEGREAVERARELREAAAAQGADEETLDQQDAEILWAEGELALSGWDLEQARASFEELVERFGPSEALQRLALLADLRGERELGLELDQAAHAAAPQNIPPPIQLNEAEFEDTVRSAIATLPTEFQKALEEVTVNVAPVPSREVIDPNEPEATPPDLLGLFVGSSKLEEGEGPVPLPPSIWIFQRNLERACASREDLEEEIAVTLYHELGHWLGFDEEGVAGLGLE